MLQISSSDEYNGFVLNVNFDTHIEANKTLLYLHRNLERFYLIFVGTNCFL